MMDATDMECAIVMKMLDHNEEDAVWRDRHGPTGSCIVSLGCLIFLVAVIAAAIKTLY